jgi:uncharacterized protein with GYD domain
MPHFLIQVGYSPTATKSLVDNPDSREETVRRTVESAGGKLHQIFFAFGKYDVILLAEFPTNQAAAAVGLATSATGALSHYHTTVLMTPQEALEAMTKAKSIAYTPPR